ncbi:hypothetical protein E4U40_000139, partial [Claviceps sp. LM458 group G5]
ARRGDPSTTDSAFFSDAPVTVHQYKCTGIKQYEHLDDALKAPHYDANDHPYWKDRERISAMYREPNNLQTAAVAWIWPRLKEVSNDKACSESDGSQQLAPCKLQLKRSLALIPGEHYQWFLRCSNIPDEMDFSSRSGHRCISIPDMYGNNEDVRKIFREILNDPKARRHTNRGSGCSCVDRTIRSKKTCGTWLRSHAMKVFSEDHNARTLSDVHPAFSNDDRLNYFIAKHKGIHQNGYRGREAVRFEWSTYHQDSPDTAYIQSFYDDGEDFLAVCFTKGMAKLWKHCKTFQCDMNFKRVNGKKDHEVIFAQRIDEKLGFITLARAYLSGQSAEHYRRLFETLFECLQKNGVAIKWKYAEGEGVVGVTVDQDAGCIKGLGLYLAGKYPNESEEWEYHTERTVRLCEIHYQRGISM